MADRPKVLFISHSPYFGGAERCLYYLLKGLNREKYNVSVLMPPKPPIHRLHQRNLRKLIRELDIPVHRSPLKWWLGQWPRYRAFADGLAGRVANIVSLIRREQFDMVVSNTSVIIEGALAARYCGIPHVWHILEMLDVDPMLHSFIPLDRLYHIMDGLSSRIVTVSEAVKKQFVPYINNDKLRVVHTGLPVIKSSAIDQPKTKLFNLPEHTPVVTFVGLLSERKGVLDFVDSAPNVLQRFPKAIFVIAGAEGGKGREVIRKIGHYGIRDSFKILGTRNDIPDILAASDMLVLPSLADPLPLAVLEAMAVGVPVVATRSGGCEEMVQHGQTGYLVPVKSPAMLSQAIVDLLKTPSQRVLMGLNGQRRFAEKFTYAHYISGFEQVLDEAYKTPRDDSIGDDYLVDSLVAELRNAAQTQARLMSAQGGGMKNIRNRFEASIRRLSLM